MIELFYGLGRIESRVMIKSLTLLKLNTCEQCYGVLVIVITVTGDIYG
jgi:hypothetical protein